MTITPEPVNIEPFPISLNTKEEFEKINTKKNYIPLIEQISSRIAVFGESNTLLSSLHDLAQSMSPVSFCQFHALVVKLKYPKILSYEASKTVKLFSTLSCKPDVQLRAELFVLYKRATMNYLCDKKVDDPENHYILEEIQQFSVNSLNDKGVLINPKNDV